MKQLLLYFCNWREPFKLALSMTLFYLFVLWMNWDMSKYGALAIILIAIGSAGASIQKGVLRVIGTTIGLIVGMVMLAWFSQERLSTLTFLSIYLCFISYMMQGSRYSYAWFVAGFMPLIIWSSTYGNVNSAFHYSIFRYLETTVGVIIYSLVSVLFWPQRASKAVNQQGQELLGQLQLLFESCYEKLIINPHANGNYELFDQLPQQLANFETSIQHAYSDSARISSNKKYWEIFRVNLHFLMSNLNLLHQSLKDCDETEISRLSPQLKPALDKIKQRLDRMLSLWQQRAHHDSNESDEDEFLLQQTSLRDISLGLEKTTNIRQLAIQTCLQQLELLDEYTLELMKDLRVLAGIVPSRKATLATLHKEFSRKVLWDPAVFRNALFPTACFFVTFILWIYVAPPHAQIIPTFAGIVSMLILTTPMNGFKLYVTFLMVGTVIVAPVIFVIMPRLSGYELLAFIFCYCYIFGCLGHRWPMLKLLAIALFVMMAGISNQQSYSFSGYVNSFYMMAIAVTAVAVLDIILLKHNPQRVFAKRLKTLFASCGFILTKPMSWTSWRSRYHFNDCKRIPRQLIQLQQQINNYHEMDVKEQMKHLILHVQRLVNWMEILMITQLQSQTQLPSHLRKLLGEVFQHWAQADWVTVKRADKSYIQALFSHYHHQFNQLTPQQLNTYGRYLSCLRGLLLAMRDIQKMTQTITWF